MNASSLWQVLGSVETGYALPLTQTLLHFLWQGCAVAIAYALAARLLRQASANARYVVGVAALLLMAACLPVTFLLIPSAPQAVDTAALWGPNARAPAVAESAEDQAAGKAETQAEPMVSTGTAAAPAVSTPTAGASPQQTAAQRLTAYLVEAAPYASSLYVVGVVLMLLRVALGLWGGRRLRLGCTPVTEEAILEMIASNARHLGMRIGPMVAYCERISVPVVVGVVRPVILLPASLALGLTPRQLEAVLAHELAHIRRFDLAVNVLQRLVEAVLFFHPAVWWVSRRVSAERENACDDLVVRSHCGRLEYADALVRMGELCAALGNRNLLEQSALAATGSGRSQFKRRVLRLLQTREEPTVRLTTGGVIFMVLLIVSTLLMPVAWRNAVRAAEQPKTAKASTSKTSSETPKPISMSAKEFGRLPVAEQRAILTRAFQRRLEHAKNLLVETATESNGSYGKYRYWQLGESFHFECENYRDAAYTQSQALLVMGVNAEEGIARVTNASRETKTPPSGQIQYPVDVLDSVFYLRWLAPVCPPTASQNRGVRRVEYLFPCLLENIDHFKIESPVEGDKVRITFPWKPNGAEQAGGSRVYLLDPQKGFLPVRCDSRYDDPPGKPGRQWRSERFLVEESRLVGDVWMPTKLTEQLATSVIPNMVTVIKLKATRLESGTVKPSDLMVPFSEGMEVRDMIEGVTYVTDAQGRPAGGVTVDLGCQAKPPEGWVKGTVAGYSLASQFSAADRESIQTQLEMRKPVETALKVLQADPPAPQEQRIEAALEILWIYRIGEKEEAWASAIRALIEIGKPAVPKLIEELDRTEKNETLRALGFVLRGIDDRRAVPALIRAIPRTLQPPGSDFGLRMQGNPELLKFMQRYDIDKGDRGDLFTYGRPIREIMLALEKMTGQQHGWQELNFARLEGGAEQQRLQRQAFLKLARRWADWWTKNWQRYVEKEADAQLDLIQRSLDQYSRSIVAIARPSRSEFPQGPNVIVGNGSHDLCIRSFDESPSSGLLDLDLGSHPCPPQELVARSAGRQPSPELLAWAEREGVDLITIRFTPTGSDQPTYAFLPVGLKVWRIENAQFDAIQEKLRQGEQPDLSLPWEGPLAQVDAQGRAYDEDLTMSFLFITSQGTCGVLQLQDPISRTLTSGTPSPGKGGLLYKYVF